MHSLEQPAMRCRMAPAPHRTVTRSAASLAKGTIFLADTQFCVATCGSSGIERRYRNGR